MGNSQKPYKRATILITIVCIVLFSAIYTQLGNAQAVEYSLTVNVPGSGGSVSPNQGTYTSGTQVQLTATPTAGYQFSGWSGDLTGTANPETITMNANKVVTATFSLIPPVEYTLTVNVPGSGGSVSPNQGTYTSGTQVQLTATPTAGYQFSGWSGDLTGTANPETITMNGNKVVTATFSLIPPVEYTLTVNVPGSGGSVSPNQGTYTSGTQVQLTATPTAGYQFSGWSGDLTGTANPETITMNANKVVTATFSLIPPVEYTLTVNVPGSGGSVSPNQGTYTSGTQVQLTATPTAGYQFSGWSGDLTGTANPETITMNANKVVTATFSLIPPVEYTLTVNVPGSGGSVSPNQGTYTSGTQVQLTATPTAGYQFSGWSGDLTGTANPETITMNGNKVVTATFSLIPPVEYTLTVNVPGSGGSVSPNQGTYTSGTQVQLTATPTAGYQFSGWSGDLTGTANPETITMNGNKVVTATFSLIPPVEYTLTVNVPGSGGSVSPNQGTYTSGTQVQLTATPTAGYQFSGWSGDLTGTANPETITMNANKVVTATFSLIPPVEYTLTVNVPGSGGSVSPNQGTYTSGTQVQLTATPTAGYQFSGWSGDLTGTANPETITMNANKVVTATFSLIPPVEYTLTVNVPGSGGSVSPNQGTYTSGTQVQLTATPTAGYQFSGWSGDLTGTANPETITMNANKVVTATFSLIPPVEYTLTVNVPGSGGSVSPNQGTYTSGTQVQLTATPTAGYQFSGWSGDLTGTANPETITMNGNKVVTATFSLIPPVEYTLTVNVPGSGGSVSPNQGTYTSGTQVQLTATPTAGYQFSGWSGDLTGTANPETITMNANKVVTATFSLIPPVEYTLTVNVPGSGGSVSPNQGTYTSGTQVQLTATPTAGYQFSGWSGDLTGTANPETITMNANKVVTATFSLIPPVEYTLTVNVPGSGGSVSPNQGTYTSGTQVQLTATPTAGYQFSGWSGDLTGTANPETITMNANKVVTATFVENPAATPAPTPTPIPTSKPNPTPTQKPNRPYSTQTPAPTLDATPAPSNTVTPSMQATSQPTASSEKINGLPPAIFWPAISVLIFLVGLFFISLIRVKNSKNGKKEEVTVNNKL